MDDNMNILPLIGLISTGAESFVREALASQRVSIDFFENSALNHGIFCVAEHPECVIAYAAFRKYSDPDSLCEAMRERMRPYLHNADETREICFNVYGRNSEIIAFARELGFASDMEGYELKLERSEPSESSELSEHAPSAAELVERGFTSEMLESFIHLFERAYAALNEANGWPTDGFRSQPGSFLQRLHSREQAGQVRSFWLGGRLVGAYVIAGTHIRDLVIDPAYQNRGFGRILLNSCINRMSSVPGQETILLRVAKSNAGAKRFYERNRFTEQACFAEHTFRKGG
ncbi:GNAT family N-acetyltransferase [Paenibacillus rhizovicinus]|uniref:GNAT family N-acetyltransferase n=1 Tax=Paenibacillus rhizovicinus TaxID=2704463 RepID=A0A6C0P3A3_9BACL|nr:GNAT family N-acetyltransferase [Paenibacillus rhizovicinus]QHW33050.1 GNAT family N-acetyltransferase [Paenibacillus rhizovicinus]